MVILGFVSLMIYGTNINGLGFETNICDDNPIDSGYIMDDITNIKYYITLQNGVLLVGILGIISILQSLIIKDNDIIKPYQYIYTFIYNIILYIYCLFIKNERKTKGKSNIHVHIGAGKLGLGLLLPSLIETNEHELVVIQRNSNSWKIYKGRDTVFYRINDKNAKNNIMFYVVRCKDDWEYYWNNVNQKMILLVLTDDNELTSYIINVATSFSCSLGKAMKPVLHGLFMNENVRDSKRVLFAGENNHDVCYDVKRELSNKVNIVPLMVDRICTQRHITEEYIDIECEPFEGEILIMKNLDMLEDRNDDEVVIPPMHGKTVLYGQNDDIIKYFFRRKKLLVNGSHTTLAFMTLVKNNDNRLDTPLIGTNNPEMDKNLYYWSLARLLILFNEYNTNTLYNAHKIKNKNTSLLVKSILLYVNQTLKRFYSVNNDTVKRVLSGGIKNRYNTRLNNVNLFINDKFDSIKIDTLCNELLSSQATKLETIHHCVNTLTHNAKKFKGLTITK